MYNCGHKTRHITNIKSIPITLSYTANQNLFHLKDLMNELDRNYRIIFPSDGKYGGKSSQNFGWNGMVGMVLDNVSCRSYQIECDLPVYLSN